MSLVTLHMLPLTVSLLPNGGLQWSCDVPGAEFHRQGDDFTLKLLNKDKFRPGDRYCYVVTDPDTGPEAYYYATVFSGPPLEKKVRWTRREDHSYSPHFDIDSGQHTMTIVASVTVERRPGKASTASTRMAPHQVYYAKSHGKAEGAGGGGRIGE